jgi:hypothetical protein
MSVYRVPTLHKEHTRGHFILSIPASISVEAVSLRSVHDAVKYLITCESCPACLGCFLLSISGSISAFTDTFRFNLFRDWSREGEVFHAVELTSRRHLYTNFRYDWCRRSNNIKVVRSEFFTAVTMKNAVLWDIKPSSYFTEDTLRLRYRAQPVNAM